jgi:hypothetical protein
MGHKRIDETMIYVHVAEAHRRDIPAPMLAAAVNETDPDRRILKDARCAWQPRGSKQRVVGRKSFSYC